MQKVLILLNGSALLAKPDDINNMTWQQKSDLIQNYPVICATNFEHMVQLFIEDVLKSNLMPIGEMVYLFHRVDDSSKGDYLTYMHYFGYLVAYESPPCCYTIIQLSMLMHKENFSLPNLNNRSNFHIHE